MFLDTTDWQGFRRTALSRAAGALWRIPGSFGVVRVLGRQYSLRCVLFHHIADTESSFTRGLNVTTSRTSFETALKFLTRHYTPVRLQDVLAAPDSRYLPSRPVLLTFDDSYASIAEVAAPLCWKYGVPAVFFINAACLDGREWALDNLICHVANVFGFNAINDLIRAVLGDGARTVSSLSEIFASLLPEMSLERRTAFREALAASVPEEPAGMGLYLTRQQLRTLPACNFEIGNHTYTHVHCRVLSHATLRCEVDKNRAELEAVSGTKVRSFSVPYGSAADLTTDLRAHLGRSGHSAVFLSESVANCDGRKVFQFDRVSARANNDPDLFAQIEVLPRLRAVRNRLLRRRNQNPLAYSN